MDDLLTDSSKPTPAAKLVVFGATGDLVSKRLMRDSMVYLAEHDQLQPGANDVVLVGAREQDGRAYLDAFNRGDAESTPLSPPGLEKFAALTGLEAPGAKVAGLDVTNPSAFKSLLAKIGTSSALYYAALPPSLYPAFLAGIKSSGLAEQNGNFRRVLLEKPFGTDAASARALQAQIERDFEPGQVMLVDHFLAYPGTLDVIGMRSDPALNQALSKKYVDKVEVKLLETIRSNDRPYFRHTGIVKDMIQSHAMQLLATVAADLGPISELTEERFREARTRLTQSLELDHKNVQHGQFVGFNDPAQGAPVGAEPSHAETFARFNLKVHTRRWEGVPFVLTAAKGVDQNRFGVDVHLRELPPALAERLGVPAQTKAVLAADISPTRLELTLDDGRHFKLQLDQRVNDEEPPHARLLRDAMLGETGLFVDAAGAVKDWDVVEEFERDAGRMLAYAPGTSADQIGSTNPTRG
ncbi:MAG: hypothetical protein KC910_12410 [Candidatus Eremiobacteraeota bacterium]|nr:hypothetical protein [Candidatus Eremiobacteraeota bacterium]